MVKPLPTGNLPAGFFGREEYNDEQVVLLNTDWRFLLGMSPPPIS